MSTPPSLGTGSFKLTEAQIAATTVCAGPQRHTAIDGGARAGKTFLYTKLMFGRAIRSSGSNHVALRLRTNAARASLVAQTIPKMLRLCYPSIAEDVRWRSAQGYYELPNDSRVWIDGLDEDKRIEKILGREFSTIFFNECSQIPWSTIELVLTRLAEVSKDDETGLIKIQRAWFDLNPPSKAHWSYRLFYQHRDPGNDDRPVEHPEDYAVFKINPVDNQENLDPEYLRALARMPERTKKRFYYGQYSEAIAGQLWNEEMIAACQISPADIPAMQSIVVAIDPSGAEHEADEDHDEIGIIVAGLGVDGDGYVLDDLTLLAGPGEWGKIGVAAAKKWAADFIVAEKNFGGAMVEFVIKTANPGIPVRMVDASRAKHVRAEPVSALYDVKDEKGRYKPRIHHVTDQYDAEKFRKLESQLCGFGPLGYTGERSPNNADALVWAITKLMIEGTADQWIQHYKELALKAHTDSDVKDKPKLPFHAHAEDETSAKSEESNLSEAYNRAFNGVYSVKAEQSAAERCAWCHKPIEPGQKTKSDGTDHWHFACGAS